MKPGDPAITTEMKPRQKVPYYWTLEERMEFYTSPEPMSGCWLWTGPVTGSGYGWIGYGGRHYKAHHLWFERLNGFAVAPGVHLCHKCDVPLCVNPDHLFQGTDQDNLSDMAKKRRGCASRSGLPFGVYRQERGGRYGARLTYRKTRFYLGTHDTVAGAAAAVEARWREVYGAAAPVEIREVAKGRKGGGAK